MSVSVHEENSILKKNIEVKKALIDSLESKNGELERELSEVQGIYKELEKKLEIAVEALEFYANFENWLATSNGQYKYEGIFFISRDNPYLQTENGTRAFKALAAINGEGV